MGAEEEYQDLNFDRQNMEDDGKYEGKYENSRLGPLIKQAREAQGLSLGQVAGLTGLSTDELAEIEDNARESTIATLRRIIEVGLNGTIEFTIRI